MEGRIEEHGVWWKQSQEIKEGQANAGTSTASCHNSQEAGMSWTYVCWLLYLQERKRRKVYEGRCRKAVKKHCVLDLNLFVGEPGKAEGEDDEHWGGGGGDWKGFFFF